MFTFKSLKILKQCEKGSFQKIIGGSRTLYSDETLNLVRYRQVRFDAQCNVTGPERFKWELKTYLQNVRPLERDRVTKAYENLVYMVNKTPDDLDLLKEAMHAVAKFEKSLPKAFKHTLGNLSIKALYVIGDEDTANTLMWEPSLKAFFGGFGAWLLFYDMLYNNGKYKEIASMNPETFQTEKDKSRNFARFFDALILGACYKMNTPESFEHASGLWIAIEKQKPFERSVAFMAALALNREKPELAADIARTLPHDFVLNQIQLAAMSQMGYIEQVHGAIKSLSRRITPDMRLGSDVAEIIKNAIESSESPEMHAEFQKCYDLLKAENVISSMTLDDILDTPLEKSLRSHKQKADNKLLLSM